jgi:S-DNA-T family DNA segregation ATPase FtsK/SpoIIIE
MAKAQGRPARARKAELRPALDGRYLFSRLAWLALAVAWVLTSIALLSFDAADAPSHVVWPHNEQTRNLIGAVGAHTAYAILKLVGFGALPAMVAWVLALVLTASGRFSPHPLIRTGGVVLMTLAFSGMVRVLTPDAGPMPGLSGGMAGVVIAAELVPRTGLLGSVLILIAVLVSGLILTFDRLVFVAGGWLWRRGFSVARHAGTAAAERARAARVRQTDLDDAQADIAAGRIRKRAKQDARIDEMAGGPGGGEAFDPDLAAVKPVRGRGDRLKVVDEDELEEEWDEEWDEDADGGDDEFEEDEDDESDAEEDDDDEDEVLSEGDEDDDEPPGAPQIFDRDKLREKISALPVRFASADKGSATQEDLDTYQQHAQALAGYKFPTLDLLEEPEEGFSEILEEYVREQAETLEEALREYKIRGEVVGIESGPVITLYHVRLAPGTKVAALNAVSSDLARSLKAVNIRIVPNMAGRDTVGIEVPNAKKEKVRLKELMRNREAFEKMKLPMFLGKDASGEPLIADLTKMPHMLIAGTTGSGKSVCMNTIVMSFLYTKKPNELKLVLVDPKMVEMSQFKDIPHLMCPVVTEMSKAAAILEWAVGKMDERYELLAEGGCRDIASYNDLEEDELIARFTPHGEELSEQEKARIPRKLPYMVFIIDELADLMMTNKEVEGSIVRIAQKARAVGIHLILATQRPQANVVTGLIKGNMPCRITFKVASGLDSRIVLDQKGGELLLGMGDMLFLSPSSHKLNRAQGTLVDDKEIRRVTKFLKEIAGPSFERSLVQIRGAAGSDADRLAATENNSSASLKAAQEDPLFDRAVEIVLQTKRGSVSLLQRRLAIGYTRASRLIDLMGIAGIIGEHKGSVAREVMITPEEWEAIKALAEEMAAQQGVEYPRARSADEDPGADQRMLFDAHEPTPDDEDEPAGDAPDEPGAESDGDDSEEEEGAGEDDDEADDEEWEWVEEEIEEEVDEEDEDDAGDEEDDEEREEDDESYEDARDRAR